MKMTKRSVLTRKRTLARNATLRCYEAVRLAYPRGSIVFIKHGRNTIGPLTVIRHDHTNRLYLHNTQTEKFRWVTDTDIVFTRNSN